LILNYVLAIILYLYGVRLQELSATSDENADYSDLELIQNINVNVVRLLRLLIG
jgi:hypothetical protein